MSWRTVVRCPMAVTQKRTGGPSNPRATSSAVSLNSRPVSANLTHRFPRGAENGLSHYFVQDAAEREKVARRREHFAAHVFRRHVKRRVEDRVFLAASRYGVN